MVQARLNKSLDRRGLPGALGLDQRPRGLCTSGGTLLRAPDKTGGPRGIGGRGRLMIPSQLKDSMIIGCKLCTK